MLTSTYTHVSIFHAYYFNYLFHRRPNFLN